MQHNKNSVARAETARQSKGLQISDVARTLQRSPRYIRAIELHGNAPYHLARQLAKLYDCPMELFLYGSIAASRRAG